MAEAVVIPLAKSALQQLSSPAMKEILLLWNSKKELKKLRATIESITHVLQDAEKRKLTDQLVKGWLLRLRSAMYEADDLFDTLFAIALHKKTMNGNSFMKEVQLFFSESNQVALMFKTAHAVKDVRESLDAIAKDMGQFGFIRQQIDDKPITIQNREPTHSFINEKDVIGRDLDRDQIVNLLLSEDRGERTYNQCFSVVAIIGAGGFGKTTLGQLVYNDERVKVKGGFDLCIWVCINYFSDLGKVLKEIIASTGIEPPNIGLDPLQKKFREIINGKKYLLVLDDVWDECRENWHKLMSLLDCGRSGSKVLVTTRSREVARCLDALEPYYHLGVLDEESAWSLFVKMAFDERELSKLPKLVSLGKQIIHRCGRVPLTLRVVGSLLRHREKDEKTWSQFANNELGEVISDDYDKNVMQVLMASYNDLPPNLKLCFAYCSLFPKDYKFDKDELVRLWLAQGFIKPHANEKQSLEEVGEVYFFYLVDRCFFQEVEKKVKFSQCCGHGHIAKVHDMLHDLAINVARTDCILLDQVPNDKQRGGNLRHISICSNLDCDYSALVSYPKTLRTLLFQRRFISEKPLGKSSLNMLFGSFRMIRTLKLSYMRIGNLPSSVGDLIHLRYLDLSGNFGLKAIPNSFSKLHHLMVFLLAKCVSLEKLPSNIEKLVSLRHLCLEGCDTLVSLPSGLATLTCLVNLDRLIVHRRDGGLRYLKQLDNLCGALIIELPEEGWINATEDANESKMSTKHKLNGLIIKWKPSFPTSRRRHAHEMSKDEAKAVLEALQPHDDLEYLQISRYCGDILPSWVCSLHNLKELCLYQCGVEYLEDIGMHNSLFPLLQVLRIENMKNLKGWWRQVIVEDEDQMSSLPFLPNVTKVIIRYCPLLTERMPFFGEIEHLTLGKVDVKLLEDLLVSNTKHCSPYLKKSRLKELHLSSIGGLCSLPEGWLSHLIAIHTLTVHHCYGLGRVSCRGLARLTNLERLEFTGCGDLSLVDEAVESHQVAMPWKAFQRLRVLEMLATDLDTRIQEGLQYLTSLEELRVGIDKRPEAEDVKLAQGGIEIDEFPSEALRKLRRVTLYFGGTTSSRLPKGIEYLHSLEFLSLGGCKELYLSWTTVLITMKLRSLEFWRVKSVIQDRDIVVEQQSQLNRLLINDGAEWIHDIPWKMLGSLAELQLSTIGEMEHLRDGVQHLTSLQTLEIFGCEKLRSLPNWIRNLTSLRRLIIDKCSAELEQRCEQGSGADWHLISHVQHVHIGWHLISHVQQFSTSLPSNQYYLNYLGARKW